MSPKTEPTNNSVSVLQSVLRDRHMRKVIGVGTLITLALLLISVSWADRIAFPDVSLRPAVYLYFKLGYAAVIFAAATFLTHFIIRVLEHDRFYLSWLRHGAVYLLIMAFLLLFTWPGYWRVDEFYTFEYVRELKYSSWQSYITMLYYTFSLMLFPSGVLITLWQIIMQSFAVGYILARLKTVFPDGRRYLFGYIPFLLPAVLLYNLNPMRMTMYAYLEVLFVFTLLLAYTGRLRVRYRHIAVLSVGITLLALWRTEGIYYLILGPLALILAMGKRSRAFLLRSLLIFVTTFAVTYLYISVRSTPEDREEQARYSVTAFVNPLSVMLQSELRSEDLETRLAAIDRVVSLESLQQYPSYNEVPALWVGNGLRPDFEDHLPEFRRQYLLLVAENPGLFLDARIKTLLSTNGFDAVHPSAPGTLTQYYRGRDVQWVDGFVENNRFSSPVNMSLREDTIDILRGVNPLDGSSTIFTPVFFSFIPHLLIHTAGTFVALVRRRWFWVTVGLLILLRVGLMFLTAPANYFMYYLSVYLVSSFLIVYWLLRRR
ncbi:MAG: hypothetical protein TR69_WS6001001410 [candidate division WS6 bacterium OLB20]|uniref:Glycosyltransferase RgtA/B/C/D-like domain-containing protein n=1 Tax=candidate division WS6 bacterium OLB20 TaxID=1617426 RepID=A0A136LVW0_9BACT|nr:MAG: hypothetical protein TR69_WS6001001410 [candidate division WS6 bacterium OLB20]